MERPKLSGKTKADDERFNKGPGFIGTIRIGEKYIAKSGNQSTRSVDHFLFDSPYAEECRSACGDKPTKLSVFFISPDRAFSCYDRYELRDAAGKAFGLADGLEMDSNIYFWKNQKWMKVAAEHVAKYDGDIKKLLDSAAAGCGSRTGWTRRLTLRFMLLDVPGLIGYFEFHTGGEKTSIPNIISAFNLVYPNAGTAIVPFDLRVAMATSDRSGDSRKYPVISLIPNYTESTMNQLGSYIKTNTIKSDFRPSLLLNETNDDDVEIESE